MSKSFTKQFMQKQVSSHGKVIDIKKGKASRSSKIRHFVPYYRGNDTTMREIRSKFLEAGLKVLSESEREYCMSHYQQLKASKSCYYGSNYEQMEA